MGHVSRSKPHIAGQARKSVGERERAKEDRTGKQPAMRRAASGDQAMHRRDGSCTESRVNRLTRRSKKRSFGAPNFYSSPIAVP